jgi:hypothetical protein
MFDLLFVAKIRNRVNQSHNLAGEVTDCLSPGVTLADLHCRAQSLAKPVGHGVWRRYSRAPRLWVEVLGSLSFGTPRFERPWATIPARLSRIACRTRIDPHEPLAAAAPIGADFAVVNRHGSSRGGRFACAERHSP